MSKRKGEWMCVVLVRWRGKSYWADAEGGVTEDRKKAKEMTLKEGMAWKKSFKPRGEGDAIMVLVE